MHKAEKNEENARIKMQNELEIQKNIASRNLIREEHRIMK
jgi:hypothetical protein